MEAIEKVRPIKIKLADPLIPLANAESNSPFQEWLGFLITKSTHHKINTRLQGFSPQFFSIYVKKRVNEICCCYQTFNTTDRMSENN